MRGRCRPLVPCGQAPNLINRACHQKLVGQEAGAVKNPHVALECQRAASLMLTSLWNSTMA